MTEPALILRTVTENVVASTYRLRRLRAYVTTLEDGAGAPSIGYYHSRLSALRLHERCDQVLEFSNNEREAPMMND